MKYCNLRNLGMITLFPHYANLTEDDLKEIPRPQVDYVPNSDNEILSLIFAPDPVTGVPRSDLAVLMSKDTAPQVSQFIRDNLLSPRSVSFVSVDDPDLALQGIKSRNESLVDYADRLRSLAFKSD